MNRAIALVTCLVTALAVLATVGGQPAHAAACADYPDQAAAQYAADARDPNGDGICSDGGATALSPMQE
jgi:hypothetical protein